MGVDAKLALRAKLEKLFREYQVEWLPIIIDITTAEARSSMDGTSLTLRPKAERVRRS